MYYEARDEDVPTKWMQRVKQCLRYVSANYNCQRMIDDYHSQFYQPAHRAWEAMARDKFAAARQHAVWGQQVKQLWPQVRFLEASAGPGTAVLAGASLPLQARVDLAGLSAADVRVEALVGKIGPARRIRGSAGSNARSPGTTRNGIYVWAPILPFDHRPPGFFRPRNPQPLHGPPKPPLQRPYKVDDLEPRLRTIDP